MTDEVTPGMRAQRERRTGRLYAALDGLPELRGWEVQRGPGCPLIGDPAAGPVYRYLIICRAERVVNISTRSDADPALNENWEQLAAVDLETGEWLEVA